MEGTRPSTAERVRYARASRVVSRGNVVSSHLRSRRHRERHNPAAQRAIRAATEREPWLPRGFLLWTMGRVLAMILLLGAAWLVYDFGSSSQFQVRSIQVQGNVLL